MDMDISQYKELFVSEATEHLEALNQSLVELEKDPENPDMLTEIFRSAHTLKGMSATLGFDQLTELSHEMENILDGLRAGDLLVTQGVLDLLFDSLDVLSALVKAIAEDSTQPVDTRVIIAELRGMVEGQKLGEPAVPMDSAHKDQEAVSQPEAAEPKKATRSKKAAKEAEELAETIAEEAIEPEPVSEEEAAETIMEAEEEEVDEGLSRVGEGEETEEEAGADEEKLELGSALFPLDEEDMRMLARESVGGIVPYLLGITLDQDCVLKSVRVFMVFKKLSQIGKIAKSIPPVEDLEDEKFEHSFKVVLLSRENEAAIRKSLATIAEVEKGRDQPRRGAGGGSGRSGSGGDVGSGDRAQGRGG